SILVSGYCSGPDRHLHSFPTRRSSDLRREEARATKEDVRGGDRGGARRSPPGEGTRSALASRSGALPRVPSMARRGGDRERDEGDRKSTRLNSSHVKISYAVFCLKKKN